MPGNWHRAGAERDLPGQRRLQQPGQLDGPDQGRRHDLDAPGRARRARTAARTRQCLPPNGYRAPDETTVTNSVDRDGNVYVTWADHRNNTNPNCELGAGRRRLAPPCDHDIFYAFSTDGGSTWSATTGRHAALALRRDRAVAAVERGHEGRHRGSGSRSTTATTATARPRAATTSPPPQIRNPASNHPNFSYTRVTTSVDAEPDAGEQPGAGRLPRRLHVGRHRPATVTRTSSGRTRARSGATLRRRTSTTPRSIEAADGH